MRMLRDHGQDPKRRYYHPVIGYNYRMTNLQAAIGTAQLEKINSLLSFKNKISVLYKKYLMDVPGIISPDINYEVKSVCWLYSILLDTPYPISRDELMKKLKNKGVETRPFFWPISALPPYKSDKEFPNSEYISDHGLNLPSGYNLTEKDIKYICDIIKNEIKN